MGQFTGLLVGLPRRGGGGGVAGHLGLAELVERPTHVDARAARPEGLTQPDAAYRLGQRGRTQGHVAGQLRPCRKRTVHFDKRCRHPWGQTFGVQVAQDVRDLVPAAHPRQQSDVEFAEQAVQDGTVRFQIETFHVDQAAVTGRHQHRDSAGLGAFAHHGLHVQRVAFLDDDVETVEELVNGVVGQSGVEHLDRKVGVQFGDAPGRDRRLVHPEIEQRGRDPVQVGQFEAVEVGQPQLADTGPERPACGR